MLVSVVLGMKRRILLFNVYQTPVWYFVAYVSQGNRGNVLPFMKQDAVYTEYEAVSRVVVDNIPYTQAASLVACRSDDGSWVQVGNLVYVHFLGSASPWLFINLFQEVKRGFTNEYTYIDNGLLFNIGFLKYIPKIREEADDMEYATMKFKSENIELVNKNGMFDNASDYLGSDVFMYVEKVLTYKLYVKNIKIKLESVTFECGDVRERFQALVPDKKFSKEEFPYIKEDYVDQYMQEVLGSCSWVPCVCVDELDIFQDDGVTKKETRTFRVASQITSLSRVMVKMTQPPEKGGGEVFTNQTTRAVLKGNGTFTLDIKYCMPAVWEGDEVPEVFDVYAFGNFVNISSPSTISPLVNTIKYLLNTYENLSYTSVNFDTTEFEAELKPITAPIGMVLDTPTRIFDIISRLQTGSNYDFQFFVTKDKFSAKRDDNARAAHTTLIRVNDIMNIHDVEIDMNNDLYATVVDIGYNMNYHTNELTHYTNEKYKWEIKNRNNYDKVYENETLIYRDPTSNTVPSDVTNKSNRLIEFFRNIHPSINNIQIKASLIPGLRIYDVVNIDLRVLLEDRNKVSMFAGVLASGFSAYDVPGGVGVAVSPAWSEVQQYRNFGGVIKGKVMSVEHDVVMGTMTIGVTKL